MFDTWKFRWPVAFIAVAVITGLIALVVSAKAASWLFGLVAVVFLGLAALSIPAATTNSRGQQPVEDREPIAE